ncbi:MAG: TIGR03905 family TSCPD domain-containing protein [Candidatus Ornithospirochaeta sp.]|nr:TIGR03905 family TSCPD domain-containing protein [Candidatus Ornithospirochaeta sp.]
MKQISYRTKGTCSSMISFTLDDDERIHDLAFVGGCNGNLKGIGKLCEGMKAKDVADRIEGTTCGFKSTSCPDQLAKAIREALA